jgi:hypothetical protein
MDMLKLLLLALLWMTLFPPSAPAGEKPGPKYGGRLVIGALKGVVTLNPFQDTRSWDYDVRSLVFEGLTGVDRLLEKARTIIDFKERKELYRDVPEICLYHVSKFVGLKPQLKGYVPSATEHVASYVGGGLPYTWIDPSS